MARQKVNRRLAAIFAADMVGYSRLMEADEEGTIARQKAHRTELIDPKISEHNGRIVKTTGDGLLVEFASVVDAVKCAVEVQQAMAEREAEIPEERRIVYRVGVNLGDIVIEGDDIFGDGVNVAARLEALAKPGEVLISGTAFDHLKNKLDYGYRFEGERKVKNIAEPVLIYGVRPDAEAGTVSGSQRGSPKAWRLAAVGLALIVILGGIVWWRPWAPSVEPARLAKMAFPLPKKPSIAVLPFNNLSGDKTQDYLADGLSENIISALSKVSEMFVIARNSTFTYKGKPVKVQIVAEEMGVRYVLEGSVQRSGDRIRVTAQLIDAVKGNHLWSERYDRKLTELFAVQDEITRKIVVALKVKLTDGEQARVRASSTRNLQAWGYGVRSLTLFRRSGKANNAQARVLMKQGIALDPQYAFLWRGLAWTHLFDARFGWSNSRAKSFQKAVAIAQKALALDPKDPENHMLMGNMYLMRRQYDKAVAEGRMSVELGPNMADVRAVYGWTTIALGEWQETIGLFKSAMRLSPRAPTWYFTWLARAYVFAGQNDMAIATAKKGLAQVQADIHKASLHRVLAFAHIEAGRTDEARRHMAEALKFRPLNSIQSVRGYLISKNPAHVKRELAALRKSGMPEN